MRKASLFQMVFLIYGAACGGAFGLEEMVSGAGPGMALLTLACLPFFWSIPIALACAELASTFPLEGGYYEWARMAFGDGMGFLAGWWSWIGIFATNASFVVLFNQYLGYWVPLSPLGQWGVALALIWATTLLNARGIRVVGDSSAGLTLLLLLPFVALVAVGLAHWGHNPFVPFTHPEKTNLGALGAAMMLGVYLYSGYDKITVTAEEVENPARNFPLALAIAVPFAAASYLLPTAAALAGHGHWGDWHEKYFSVVAGHLGGPWLANAMTASALLSNLVLLATTMLAQSRLPMAMARDGLFPLPALFAKTHRGTSAPVGSLLLGGVILSLLTLTSFAQLVTIYGVTQMLGYLLIYASLVRLRRARKGTARGYRVPGGSPGLLILVLPPVGIALFTLLRTENIGAGLIAAASGPVLYLLLRARRRMLG